MGGGVIKVVMKGDMTIESIEIAKELLDKENKEDLQDMLIAGLNEVLKEVNADKESTMNQITGGIKMPGGF